MNWIDVLQGQWPWWVGGLFIGLIVPILLLLGNKQFGVSSSLRHICAACIPTKAPYFNYDWKKDAWNLYFVGGIVIGGVIANIWLKNPAEIPISEETKVDLRALGITDFSGFMPAQIFAWEQLTSWSGFAVMVLGGFLVGFGARYSNGCTSGHTIMGISLLSRSGLFGTIGFFAGGLATTYFLLPWIL